MKVNPQVQAPQQAVKQPTQAPKTQNHHQVQQAAPQNAQAPKAQSHLGRNIDVKA